MKIFNDPVHGFIEVPRGLLRALVDHPYVQRLRRIKQMGASSYVYPGAEHTRFNHALGAMHLADQALQVLRRKGHTISAEEHEATLAAILLHDVGHGPLSHALEPLLVPGVPHEQLSFAIMQRLTQALGGTLPLALRIFEGSYHRPFLHELISGQLDLDRMDYLLRDSFFTGVSEGVVGVERIIKTLTLVPDAAGRERLVVEEKGIYSVEKFIVARRLMYWQVYFHKAALAAECMLSQLLTRVREVLRQGGDLWMETRLGRLLHMPPLADAPPPDDLLDLFLSLDDYDIWFTIKQWAQPGRDTDPVVRELAERLLQRRLLKLRFREAPVPEAELAAARAHAQAEWGYLPEQVPYFVFSGQARNQAYLKGENEPIRILYKDGSIREITQATDLHSLEVLAQPVTKYFLAQPGERAPVAPGHVN